MGCFDLMVAGKDSWMFLYSSSNSIKSCIETVCKCVQLYVVKYCMRRNFGVELKLAILQMLTKLPN